MYDLRLEAGSPKSKCPQGSVPQEGPGLFQLWGQRATLGWQLNHARLCLFLCGSIIRTIINGFGVHCTGIIQDDLFSRSLT